MSSYPFFVTAAFTAVFLVASAATITDNGSVDFDLADLNLDGFLQPDEFFDHIRSRFDHIDYRRSFYFTGHQLAKLFAMVDLVPDGRLDRDEYAKFYQHCLWTLSHPTPVLLVINAQNDFLDAAGGSMYIEGGERIVPPINQLLRRHTEFARIFFVRDYHPPDHASFFVDKHNHLQSPSPSWLEQLGANRTADNRILFHQNDSTGPEIRWRPHCVQGTAGADFFPALSIDSTFASKVRFIDKGTDSQVDALSALYDLDGRPLALHQQLQMLDQQFDGP